MNPQQMLTCSEMGEGKEEKVQEDWSSLSNSPVIGKKIGWFRNTLSYIQSVLSRVLTQCPGGRSICLPLPHGKGGCFNK